MQTSSVRHGYTTGAQGNRLHYLDYGGDGSPLICMHGVIGNAWNWYAVAAGISDRRRVLALDFRGYGESQWSGSHDYTTSNHVADLGAFIESLGEDRVDLMGSSWGALVAIQYAAENPDRVGRIVVVDVEPSFAQSETDLFPRPTSHADHEDVRTGLGFAFPNGPRRDARADCPDQFRAGRRWTPGAQARSLLLRTLALPLRQPLGTTGRNGNPRSTRARSRQLRQRRRNGRNGPPHGKRVPGGGRKQHPRNTGRQPRWPDPCGQGVLGRLEAAFLSGPFDRPPLSSLLR